MNTQLSQLVADVYILSSTFVESKRGLIVDKGGSVLIDTSISLAETQRMIDLAQAKGRPVRRVLLTHGHFDHTAGCQLLRGVERIAYDGAGEWMLSEHARNYLARRPAEHPDLEQLQITLPTLEIKGAVVLRLAQRTLHLFYTPGHSPDSMSILLEPDGVLFAGDALVTCFPPIIQDGDSSDAVASLRRILALDYQWLVPGHGPLLDQAAARRHCQTSLDYLQEIRNRLSRISDVGTPMATINTMVDDLRLLWALPDEQLAHWHSRAVSKIWDEMRAELAESECL